MRCPFCNDKTNIKEWNANVIEHLVVTKSKPDGHIHVHGPLDKKEQIQEFAQAIYAHADIELAPLHELQALNAVGTVPRNIVFKNRQAFGDILTMTSGIRDFKIAFPETRVGVITTASHIWDNNPYIDHNFREQEYILDIGPGAATNASNRNAHHMCNAFRIDIENKLGIQFDQGPINPDIWMTKEEYEKPPIIEGPYWVIIVGGEPGWTAKMYPAEGWQEVVDSMPEIQFIQLGMARHPYKHLDNVIDYIGKTEDKDTGIRDLFNIFLHAQGSVGLVSMHTHLSAAFGNPCVTINAAREPSWFTNYFGHQYLQVNSCLPCATPKACWKCTLEACQDVVDGVPKCYSLIRPSEIAAAIRKYYEGGRLQYGKKQKNTFFNNIVDEKKVYAPPKPSGLPAKYGMEWGGANPTESDWTFLKDIIKRKKVKTILQFGVNLSSLLFADEVEEVVAYETEGEQLQKIRLLGNKNLVIRTWDGITVNEKLKEFDLAFVDGPPGGKNREFATKIASEHSKEVIIHDANREWENKWQAKYLDGEFSLAMKGGNRCSWWTKSPKPSPNVDMSKPLVRVISTARGWGGCARSTTTIMKKLTDKGYPVEFVPFHSKFDKGSNMGNEFRNWLATEGKNVMLGDYWDIKRLCDVTFVYADDYVWEFSRPDIVRLFGDLNTKRKVMMVNFRRGKVGEIEWTKGWNSYGFLNSTQEKDLLKVLPDANTFVLPPCTDLTTFFDVVINYDMPLKLIRHSSQGDTKFDKDTTVDEINAILNCRPDVEIHMMPGPSFIPPTDRFIKYHRNVPPVPEFLSLGNCFYYSLPKGYHDMGPRVILEAMANSLPIIADAWGGAMDRVTSETGWLCESKEQFVEIVKGLDPETLKRKGEAARERAKKEFVADRWLKEILGEEFLQR